MTIQAILATAFGGAILAYVLGRFSAKLSNALAVGVSVLLVGLVASAFGRSVEQIYYHGFLGLDLVLRLNGLAWFFAITVSLIGCLSVIFSTGYVGGREGAGFYYFTLLLVNAAMLGIVFSGDLLSFFAFWEVMSWAAFLLISYNRGRALYAGLKYIVMSLVGSCAMLVGMLSLYAAYDTLVISELGARMGSAGSGFLLWVVLTLGLGFGVKSAMVPLHTWLPDAHSEAPSPFSAVLSGVLIKMGIYGFVVLMYAVVGLKLLAGLSSGWLSVHSVLCWLGAITILVPTFIAVLQDDAKRLLAWSSIGQIGYIILGLGIATSLGVAGSLFHTLNHAVFKALLFLAVGAVEYRTGGVRDLNQLGGLARRMPVTFACALVGGMGLIGVPLTGGFVSKWLIYKTLIAEGRPFLALAALVGTWGAVLYVYKLLHNIFLGQLPRRFARLRAASFSMRLPLAACGLLIVLFGILPGLPLRAIQGIQNAMGFAPLELTLWGVAGDAGVLNMLNVGFAIIIAFLVVFLLVRLGPAPRRVSQEDSYAAGSAVPVGRYQHSAEFYDPLYRMASPYLRDRADQFYCWIADRAGGIFDVTRRMYTGYTGTYVLYIISFLGLLIFLQMVWKVW